MNMFSLEASWLITAALQAEFRLDNRTWNVSTLAATLADLRREIHD
jgi:hypothetical protein